MLYIYNINLFRMFELSETLAFDRVSVLKENLSKTICTPINDIVLLKSSAEELEDNKIVSHYNVGQLETNPIFALTCPRKPILPTEVPYSKKEYNLDPKQMVHQFPTFGPRQQMAKNICEKVNHMATITQSVIAGLEQHTKGMNALVAYGTRLGKNVQGNYEKFYQKYSNVEDRDEDNINQKLIDKLEGTLDFLCKCKMPATLRRSNKRICLQAKDAKQRRISTTSNFSMGTPEMIGGDMSLSEEDDHVAYVSLAPVPDRYIKRVETLFSLVFTDTKQAIRHKAKTNIMFHHQIDSSSLQKLECSELDWNTEMDQFKASHQFDEALARMDSHHQELKSYVQIVNQFYAKMVTDDNNLRNQRKGLNDSQERMNRQYANLLGLEDRYKSTIDACAKILELKYTIVGYIDQLLRKFADCCMQIHKRHQTIQKYHEILLRQEVGFQTVLTINKLPPLLYKTLAEIIRRKRYSNTFMQWADMLFDQVRDLWKREVHKRKQFQIAYKKEALFDIFDGLDAYPCVYAANTPTNPDRRLPELTEADMEMLIANWPPEYKAFLDSNQHKPIPEMLQPFFKPRPPPSPHPEKPVQHDSAEGHHDMFQSAVMSRSSDSHNSYPSTTCNTCRVRIDSQSEDEAYTIVAENSPRPEKFDKPDSHFVQIMANYLAVQEEKNKITKQLEEITKEYQNEKEQRLQWGPLAADMSNRLEKSEASTKQLKIDIETLKTEKAELADQNARQKRQWQEQKTIELEQCRAAWAAEADLARSQEWAERERVVRAECQAALDAAKLEAKCELEAMRQRARIVNNATRDQSMHESIIEPELLDEALKEFGSPKDEPMDPRLRRHRLKTEAWFTQKLADERELLQTQCTDNVTRIQAEQQAMHRKAIDELKREKCQEIEQQRLRYAVLEQELEKVRKALDDSKAAKDQQQSVVGGWHKKCAQLENEIKRLKNPDWKKLDDSSSDQWEAKTAELVKTLLQACGIPDVRQILSPSDINWLPLTIHPKINILNPVASGYVVLYASTHNRYIYALYDQLIAILHPNCYICLDISPNDSSNNKRIYVAEIVRTEKHLVKKFSNRYKLKKGDSFIYIFARPIGSDFTFPIPTDKRRRQDSDSDTGLCESSISTEEVAEASSPKAIITEQRSVTGTHVYGTSKSSVRSLTMSSKWAPFNLAVKPTILAESPNPLDEVDGPATTSQESQSVLVTPPIQDAPTKDSVPSTEPIKHHMMSDSINDPFLINSTLSANSMTSSMQTSQPQSLEADLSNLEETKPGQPQ